MPIKHLSWGMGRQRRLSGGTVPEPVSLYQQWTNYPQSPVLTADYPYQAIGYIPGNGNYYLLCGSQKFYHTVDFSITSSVPFATYRKDGSVWTFSSNSVSFNINNDNSNIKECNNDIYTSALLTTVRIAKTT